MGLCEDGIPSTFLTVNKRNIIPVPKSWSLEDAATVPFSYAIVLYALFNVSRYFKKLKHLNFIDFNCMYLENKCKKLP